MRTSLACAATLFLVSGSALAQAPDAKPAAPVTTAAAQVPPPPTVDDPMLVSVPRAKTEIATWDDALRHVRARSTDLRIAMQEVQRAEGQSRVALAGALPTISGTATYTHNLITRDTLQFGSGGAVRPVQTPYPDYLTGSIVASQPLFAMRAWYGIGTASVNEDAARRSLEDTKRQIALGVANAIVGVVTAERIAELNRVGLRNALQRLELTQRKAALGGATGLDIVRSRQDVEVTRATLVAGDESLRQAREALGLALGLPEQVGVTPNADIAGLEKSARSACRVAPSVDQRADVAALRTQAEVAHRGTVDVKYQFLPTVNLQSGLSTTSIDTGAAPNTTWNIQGVLSVPIWEGGARYGNLHSAEAQELTAHEQLEAARRKATVEVEQARRGVSVADDRRKVATVARDLAAETDRLTRLAYQEGRGTSLELVTAAQALRESEIELALREFELVKARVLDVLALASCPW